MHYLYQIDNITRLNVYTVFAMSLDEALELLEAKGLWSGNDDIEYKVLDSQILKTRSHFDIFTRNVAWNNKV